MADALLNSGAQVDSKTRNGITPLLVAVEKTELDFIRLLLNSGADINAVDEDGKSVMHVAQLDEDLIP